MSGYFFLDNWTVSLLRSPRSRQKLREFVVSNGYTGLLTTLSFVELYNPGWADSEGEDRTALATELYSAIPCVLVDPPRVWQAEIKNRLDPLSALPIELDLADIDEAHRRETLLRFLRRDRHFLEQGRDIQDWSDRYKAKKASWLGEVKEIIEHACSVGNLRRGASGAFEDLEGTKELFLFSLDFRGVPPERVDDLLAYQVERRSRGSGVALTAVRLSSLLFWYAYVNVDCSNRIKQSGSDLGDIYHLSLLPYCSAFTADKAMHRLLRRIKEPFLPLECSILTPPLLEKALGI